MSDLAPVLARTGDTVGLEWALDEAARIGDEDDRALALGTVARAMVQAGDEHGAERVLTLAESWVTETTPPHSRALLMNILVPLRDALIHPGARRTALKVIDRVMEATESIQNQSDRADVLAYLGQVLVGLGATKSAVDVAAQSLALCEHEDDDWSVSQSTLDWVRALVASGDTATGAEVVRQGVETLERMHDRLTYTPIQALVTISEALVLVGETEKAVGMAVRALATDLSETSHDSEYRQGEIVHAFLRTGEIDLALIAAVFIPTYEWRVSAVGEIALALADAGERARAVNVVMRMLEPPHVEWPHCPLCEAARLLLAAGKQDVAADVVSQLMGELDRAGQAEGRTALGKLMLRRTQVDVARVLVLLGAVERAAEIAEETLTAAASIETRYLLGDRYVDFLLAIAVLLADLGDQRRAVETASLAREAVERMSKDDAFESWFRHRGLPGRFARLLAQLGEHEQMLEMMAGIDDTQWRLPAMVHAALLIPEAQDGARAARMIEEALAEAKQIEPPKARAYALKDITTTFRQVGDEEKARESAQQARAAAEGIHDEEAKVAALKAIDRLEPTEYPPLDAGELSEVAHVLAKLGEKESAIELARLAVALAEEGEVYWPAGNISVVLASISSIFLELDEYEQALEVAEGISDRQVRAQALRQIAHKLARNSRLISRDPGETSGGTRCGQNAGQQ